MLKEPNPIINHERTANRKKDMDKATDKRVKDFITEVAKHIPGLVTAYLFGSYSKMCQTEESDIDIALIIEHLDDLDKFDLQVRLMLLASDFDIRIEPHLLSMEDFNSGNPFVTEVKRTGIEIKPQNFKIA
jgi:uncharacterized protein